MATVLRSHKTFRLFQGGLLVLFVASTIYLGLLALKIPLPYIKLSTLHQIIFISGELLILLWLYRKYFRSGRDARNLAYILRDLLLSNVLFLYPYIKFYTDPIRTEIPLIGQIRPYLIFGYLALILTSGIALYLLGDIKRARSWLNSKIEAQQAQDRECEEALLARFHARMPALSRAPVLGGILGSIYRQGAVYLIALLAFAAIGLFLRLWQLGGLPPYIDEFRHLNAAKDISQGLPLDQVEYRRSLYTVTLPVAFSFRLFGMNLFAARLPGVLFNILALIPLYFLSKRINKPVALLAAGLNVFSPWLIAVSRNVREYACYPLIFYAIGLIMLKLYEAMPQRIVFQRDYRLFLQWKNFLYLALLAFVLYFVNFVDSSSTLKIVLIYYPVFGLLLMRKIDWRSKTNVVASIVILATALVVLAAIVASVGARYLRLNDDPRSLTFFPRLFFEMPAQQWYYDRPLVSIAIFLLALMATYIWDHRKYVLPFSLLTFLGGLLAFSLLFLKGERPRYAINVEFWYIVLIAVGLFCAFVICERFLPKRVHWLAWTLLVLYFFNIPQTVKASLHIEPGWHPVTNEYHAQIAPALSFLESKISPGDAVVTTRYVASSADFFAPTLLNENVVLYNGNPADGQIEAALDAHENGWIVLDYFGGSFWSQPVPLHDFVYNGKQVEFLGWYGNVYILRWDGE